MSEPNLLDELDQGRALRNQGARAAENAAHPYWRVAAEKALADLIDTGQPFTVEHIRDRVGAPMGGHLNSLGAMILGAASQGRIRGIGYQQATHVEARGRVIRVWQGTGRPAPDKPKPRRPRPLPDPPPPPPDGMWSTADVPKPCIACRKPAYLRDPAGQPRHRTDCRSRP